MKAECKDAVAPPLSRSSRQGGHSTQVSGDSSRLTRVLYAAITLALILYALQAFTPLRLGNDGLEYLWLADTAAAHGVPYALHLRDFHDFPFPKGYPLFLFALIKAGIFCSATMVLSNFLFYLAGLFFTFRTLIALGFPRTHVLLASLLSLLFFTAVKHVTQGASDFLFFAMSACVCWLLTLNSPTKWIAIVPLAVCAVEVRFIGLALAAPIAVAAWPAVKKRPALLAASAVAASLCLGLGVIAGHYYLTTNLQMLHRQRLLGFLTKDMLAHLQDFGELTINAPLTKLPSWAGVPSLVLGAVTLCCFLAGVFLLRRRTPWLSAYLLAYSALVFPWPFTDARFWLPVMPMVFLAIYTSAQSLFKRIGGPDFDRPALAYAALYALMGFAALAYSTRLTFAGPKFPYLYGDGTLTNSYLAHCTAGTPPIDAGTLHLLQRYQWHCPNPQ